MVSDVSRCSCSGPSCTFLNVPPKATSSALYHLPQVRDKTKEPLRHQRHQRHAVRHIYRGVKKMTFDVLTSFTCSVRVTGSRDWLLVWVCTSSWLLVLLVLILPPLLYSRIQQSPTPYRNLHPGLSPDFVWRLVVKKHTTILPSFHSFKRYHKIHTSQYIYSEIDTPYISRATLQWRSRGPRVYLNVKWEQT